MSLPWTPQNVSFAGCAWNSVCYGNGKYVAVCGPVGGLLGSAIVSSDGINWTQTNLPQTNWQSVCYGNELFVACGQNPGDPSATLIVTSPDGITWTPQSCPIAGWNSITFAQGKFVVVGGFPSGVMTSTDAINWTLGTTPGNNYFGVTYGNNLFVAVGLGPSSIMTSPDSITWTSQVSPDSSMNWFKVAYGNGIFVAISVTPTNNKIMTSTDGINWTAQASGVNTYWLAITFGNGLFVAFTGSSTGNKYMTSTDGLTWSIFDTPIETGFNSVTYGNGLFLAVTGTLPQQVITADWNPGPICFNEGTKILCLNKDFYEIYLPIESLSAGDIVKTYKHGYRKIQFIEKGKFYNDVNKYSSCMYCIKKTDENCLIENLIVTGGHSILVDSLDGFEEQNKVYFQGETLKIDDKYLLVAPLIPNVEKLTSKDEFTYYHFVLHNDGDNDKRFGVYANGILTETPSLNQFVQHDFFKF